MRAGRLRFALALVASSLAVRVARAGPDVRAVGAVRYQGELASVLAGGLARGVVYLDRADLGLTIEAGELTVRLDGIGMQGGSPSALVGDAQVVSNLDAVDTWKLFEAWADYRWSSGVGVRVGVYDLNSEFDVVPDAELFLNSSYGIGIDLSQSGRSGPSIFPQTGLAVRVGVRRDDTYARVAVLDGDPGDGIDRGTHLRLSREQGALVIGEVGVARDGLAVAAGGWRYTALFAPLAGGAATEVDQGAYALVDATPARTSVSVFARLGAAAAKVNRFATFAGVGVVATPCWLHRPDDRAGVGVAVAVAGAPYRSAAGIGRDEVAVEAAYHLSVRRGVGLQLSTQYVHAPSARATTPDALVVQLRLDLGVEGALP